MNGKDRNNLDAIYLTVVCISIIEVVESELHGGLSSKLLRVLLWWLVDRKLWKYSSIAEGFFNCAMLIGNVFSLAK